MRAMMTAIKILLAILSMYRVENAVAVSNNELMTADGNVWAVYDELEEGKDYTLIFDTLGDGNIYNDEIIKVI